MNENKILKDSKNLNKEVRDIWNENAYFWDEKMGEGNEFHKLLIGPTQERLLDIQKGELVLDVACGNGQFTRRMAELGARVVAFDFSERLIERAKARTKKNAGQIQYFIIDATDKDQLMTLGKRRFDSAVCTMALMDISDIQPLISSLSQLLKIGSSFVFSVSHPCFNSVGIKLVAEEENRNGELITIYSVRVSEYIHMTAKKGMAMIGQPTPQYYFDRPLNVLFNAFFKVGFVLDCLEEPVFDETVESKRAFSWANYREIPPALIVRMRLTES